MRSGVVQRWAEGEPSGGKRERVELRVVGEDGRVGGTGFARRSRFERRPVLLLALVGCVSEGWLTLSQRDFRGPTGSAAALRCGPSCARRPPTGDWQRGIASARWCERERVDKYARILWISAAMSGDCAIDAKCDQGFSGAGSTRGREYARFCP